MRGHFLQAKQVKYSFEDGFRAVYNGEAVFLAKRYTLEYIRNLEEYREKCVNFFLPEDLPYAYFVFV